MVRSGTLIAGRNGGAAVASGVGQAAGASRRAGNEDKPPVLEGAAPLGVSGFASGLGGPAAGGLVVESSVGAATAVSPLFVKEGAGTGGVKGSAVPGNGDESGRNGELGIVGDAGDSDATGVDGFGRGKLLAGADATGGVTEGFGTTSSAAGSSGIGVNSAFTTDGIPKVAALLRGALIPEALKPLGPEPELPPDAAVAASVGEPISICSSCSACC